MLPREPVVKEDNIPASDEVQSFIQKNHEALQGLLAEMQGDGIDIANFDFELSDDCADIDISSDDDDFLATSRIRLHRPQTYEDDDYDENVSDSEDSDYSIAAGRRRIGYNPRDTELKQLLSQLPFRLRIDILTQHLCTKPLTMSGWSVKEPEGGIKTKTIWVQYGDDEPVQTEVPLDPGEDDGPPVVVSLLPHRCPRIDGYSLQASDSETDEMFPEKIAPERKFLRIVYGYFADDKFRYPFLLHRHFEIVVTMAPLRGVGYNVVLDCLSGLPKNNLLEKVTLEFKDMLDLGFPLRFTPQEVPIRTKCLQIVLNAHQPSESGIKFNLIEENGWKRLYESFVEYSSLHLSSFLMQEFPSLSVSEPPKSVRNLQIENSGWEDWIVPKGFRPEFLSGLESLMYCGINEFYESVGDWQTSLTSITSFCGRITLGSDYEQMENSRQHILGFLFTSSLRKICLMGSDFAIDPRSALRILQQHLGLVHLELGLERGSEASARSDFVHPSLRTLKCSGDTDGFRAIFPFVAPEFLSLDCEDGPLMWAKEEDTWQFPTVKTLIFQPQYCETPISEGGIEKIRASFPLLRELRLMGRDSKMHERSPEFASCFFGLDYVTIRMVDASFCTCHYNPMKTAAPLMRAILREIGVCLTVWFAAVEPSTIYEKGSRVFAELDNMFPHKRFDLAIHKKKFY